MNSWTKARNGSLYWDTKHPEFEKWFVKEVKRLTPKIKKIVKC